MTVAIPVNPPMIENDTGLLDEMMSDLAAYMGKLGPGPYWAENQKATLAWLRTSDLNHFRSYDRAEKALSNFGGGSRWPSSAELETERRRIYDSLIYKVGKKFGLSALSRSNGVRQRDLAREQVLQKSIINLMSRLVVERDREGELYGIDFTPVGSPSDTFSLGGRLYSPKFLDEFLKYLDMKGHVDFRTVKSMVEVGPGVGIFTELMAKLDRTRRIYLIDIPPQLYVTEQVLSAVFPGEVCGYRDIKSDAGVLSRKDRRIFVMAPWHAESADIGPLDLAFNQVSFSEMHLDTVSGYLALLDKWHARTICLRASDVKKREEGPGGDDYIRLLPNYGLMAREQTSVATTAWRVGVPDAGEGDRTSSAFYFERVKRQ